MFKVICKEEIKEDVKKLLIYNLTKVCVLGIDYNWKTKKDLDNAIKEALDEIESNVDIEDTDDGFILSEDCPNELGFLILDIFDMGNSYCDLFAREDIGSTGKDIVEALLKEFPDISVDAEIEFDDGVSCCIEYVGTESGTVINEWEEC